MLAVVSSFARGYSDPGVAQTCIRISLVMWQGVHWAHAGFGVADSFSHGRHGDAASLHLCSVLGKNGRDDLRRFIGNALANSLANLPVKSRSVNLAPCAVLL